MAKWTVETIENKLVAETAAILAQDSSAVKVDASLHALGVTSMGFVELLVFIEKTFNLKLIETGLTREDFETIHALARRIAEELGTSSWA